MVPAEQGVLKNNFASLHKLFVAGLILISMLGASRSVVD